ncbi:MAG: VWD domain-containing protein [Deltaproteobacteria bacterium]|nr:VWD domain-containing protein [Deltaproteobacteria bacterium]
MLAARDGCDFYSSDDTPSIAGANIDCPIGESICVVQGTPKCVDLSTDVNHCGRCNRACAVGAPCEARTCWSCPNGGSVCKVNGVDTCIDLSHDRNNCGRCNHKCKNSEYCDGRTCWSCLETVCNNECVDLERDKENCGECGNVCPSGAQCLSSKCKCPNSEIVCDGSCTDIQQDNNNCGECGKVCQPGTKCVRGACVSDCVCNQWQNNNCGEGNCKPTEMEQTRSCTPAACEIEAQCIDDIACECDCNEWQDYNCGTGDCKPTEMEQTRSCTPAYCDTEVQCISAPACECQCTEWLDNDCGQGNCEPTQMEQTRSCTPASCDTEAQCINASSCECQCTEWQDNDCGAGSCETTQMEQTRSCTPTGCESEAQCIDSSTCGGPGDDWGDPHLITFDRLAYDFQGVGEFVLIRSKDDSLTVQIRSTPWHSSRVVSVTNAVAMNVADDRVGIYVGRSPALYINGSATNSDSEVIELPQGGTIEPRTGAFLIKWPDDSKVLVRLKGSYLNLKIVLPSIRHGKVEGLLGNFDKDRSNEFITREGVALSSTPSFAQLYKQFGDSWRITQQESLFDYLNDNTTDTFTDLSFPDSFISVDILSASDRTQAEQICSNVGLSDPFIIDACVLDVALTNDPSFADSAAEVTMPEDATGPDGTLGYSPDNPGLSCLDILQRGVPNGNGMYWVKPQSEVFQVYCDLTLQGGGWTRVGALDTSAGYCGNSAITDMRIDPDASMGKIPDDEVQALLINTTFSPKELMYYSRTDGRYVWHTLQNIADFDTSSKHQSAKFYCTDWHCDNGKTDASACGSEGSGCPVTAHGVGGTTKKIYVDSTFSRHIRGMHINAGMCGLPNYERASIWVYVR